MRNLLIFTLISVFFSESNCYSQCGLDSVQDYNGNWYRTVTIGSQCWLKENLRSVHYSDGTLIPHIKNDSEWENLHRYHRAYSFYDNDSALYAKTYGALYTWYAATNSDSSITENLDNVQGVCPDGWHIPSTKEWEKLAAYVSCDLGPYFFDYSSWDNVGQHLKANSSWFDDGNGQDDYGFSAVAGGYRNGIGAYYSMGIQGNWWSSDNRRDVGMSCYWHTFFYNGSSTTLGLSVRCISNTPVTNKLTISIDSIKNIDTFNGADGLISVTAIGGIPPYNYSWSNGDTTSLITDLLAGTYTLTISDLTDEISYSFLLDQPITINENKMSENYDMLIIPNPAQSNIKILINDDLSKSFNLTILDRTGTIVKKLNNRTASELNISIDNFKTGLYIIHIEGENVSYNKKLIIR